MGGGGHWTVCVGPTKDRSKLVILDPRNDVQYLDNTDAGFTTYRVMENGVQTAEGSFDPDDPNDIAVILPW